MPLRNNAVCTDTTLNRNKVRMAFNKGFRTILQFTKLGLRTELKNERLKKKVKFPRNKLEKRQFDSINRSLRTEQVSRYAPSRSVATHRAGWLLAPKELVATHRAGWLPAPKETVARSKI